MPTVGVTRFGFRDKKPRSSGSLLTPEIPRPFRRKEKRVYLARGGYLLL